MQITFVMELESTINTFSGSSENINFESEKQRATIEILNSDIKSVISFYFLESCPFDHIRPPDKHKL